MENANDPKGRKPENVKKMFSRVAAHYDVINRAMCGGLDVIWRKRLVNAAVSGARADGEKKFLDIACGSGDVCAEFLKRDASCRVTGVDFCREMLEIARKKCAGERSEFVEADCQRLPFADGTFDAATISFGFRNFNDRPACLSETARVLKAGAPLCVLEVARAEGLFEPVQKFFMCSAVPKIAKLFGGESADYEYLAKTTMYYPKRTEVEKMFSDAGFKNVKTRPMAFGMVAITSGELAGAK